MKKVYTVKELKEFGILILGYKDTEKIKYSDLEKYDKGLIK